MPKGICTGCEAQVAKEDLIESFDHTTETVPLSERRHPLTMGLLWITMVTGFPAVLVGFEWFKAGFTLQQVLLGAIVSCVVVMVYAVPAAYLGSKSGLTFALLTRRTFGAWGSRFVSVVFVCIAMAWYALAADFLAAGLKGIFHFDLPTWALGAVLALAMAFNNFFGFTGVANFARFVAGPVLLLWIGYSFCKAAGSCPPEVWQLRPSRDAATMLTTVSSFVLGYAIWGNECDFWRYGKPKLSLSVIPMAISLAIGQIMFPITGWLMAYRYRVTDAAAATDLMNQYAFGGLSLLAGIVLTISYVAINDSGLYGQINTVENVKQLPRKYVVAVLAIIASVIAAAIADEAHAFEALAGFSSVFLPCTTVVIMTEVLFLNRIFTIKQDVTAVPQFEDLSPVKWPAVIALLAGYAVGLLTSGTVPGTASLHKGVPSLLAWLVSMILFGIVRGVQLSRARARARLSGATSSLEETNRCAGGTE